MFILGSDLIPQTSRSQCRWPADLLVVKDAAHLGRAGHGKRRVVVVGGIGARRLVSQLIFASSAGAMKSAIRVPRFSWLIIRQSFYAASFLPQALFCRARLPRGQKLPNPSQVLYNQQIIPNQLVGQGWEFRENPGVRRKIPGIFRKNPEFLGTVPGIFPAVPDRRPTVPRHHRENPRRRQQNPGQEAAIPRNPPAGGGNHRAEPGTLFTVPQGNRTSSRSPSPRPLPPVLRSRGCYLRRVDWERRRAVRAGW
jgi:hypothetical protein